MQNQTIAQSEHNLHSVDQQQIDEQVETLSAQVRSRSKIGKDKLAVYKQNTQLKPKYCMVFQTKYELYISLLILLFISFGAYLAYDNHIQESKIDQLINQLQKDNNGIQHQQPSNQGTVIPKTVWYYNQLPLLESNRWVQSAYDNIRRLTQNKDYKVLLINQANWRTYLPLRRQQKIDSAIKMMSKQIANSAFPSQLIDSLQKSMILMQVLIQKGGIYVQDDVILTESLNWTENILNNQFINGISLIKNTKVIGFYDPDYSTDTQKYSEMNSQIEVDKYMVKTPSLAPYFLASVPSSTFLQDLFEQYYNLITHYSTIADMLKINKIQIQFTKDNKYDANHLFYISCQLTLRKKQMELDTHELAIQHYGLASINQNYGPKKIRSYLGQTQIDKIFNHLSLLSLQELQYEFGVIRFMAVFTPQDKVQAQFQKVIDSKSIVQSSFIHHYLVGNSGISLLKNKQEKSTSKQWTNLPKKLWVYLQTPPYQSIFFKQVWIQHLTKITKESNFELTIVTDENLHNYLPQKQITSINSVISSNKPRIYQSTKSQLISLAVLYEHGGIWVQPYTVFVDNLNWIVHIGQQKFIWNRFGELPKVVIAFHPHFGSPFHWTFDQSGTKQAWHLAYEHSFIAAQAKSELINSWFTELMTNIKLPYNEIVNRFEQCKIKDHKWISQNSQELLSQDSIKCVLGAKATSLLENGSKMSASEYYGLWGINGFAGLLKMRQYSDFQSHRSMNNPFLWRNSFSYMQKAIGNINHFSRIYKPTATKMQQLYHANFQNLSHEIHNQSFLMNLLGNLTVVKKNDKLYLQTYLKQQEQIEKEQKAQSLYNIPKNIWVYQTNNPTLMQTYAIKNIEYFSKKSGFSINMIDENNYKQKLISRSSKWLQKINVFFKMIDSKLQNQKSNLKDHFQQIKSQIIVLSILYEFGGIVISNRIVLHEDLSWLSQIKNLEYVQGIQSDPKLFAFYSPGYSSKPKNNLVQFPSLQNFFIASVQKNVFLNDFMQQFMLVIKQNARAKQKVKDLHYQTAFLHGDDPYYEAFFLASQFTFKKKTDQLKALQFNQTAIHFYGVQTINTHFYPFRLQRYYSSFKANQNMIVSLGKTFLQDLEDQVGKLRYLSVIPSPDKLEKYLRNTVKSLKGFQILNGSFIHKYILPEQQRGIVKIQMKYSNPLQSKLWQSLPKTAWIYIEKGLKSSPLAVQLLFANLQQRLTQANYALKEVNDSNIDQYIDKLSLAKISKLIKTKGNQIYKALLYRLALLHKHGGLSISHQIIPIQQMKWINDIVNIDKRLIMNRLGNLPKVLMLIDTLTTPYNQWDYLPSFQTKVGHKVGWDHDFISAEKDNQLIKDWYEQLTTYLELDLKQILELFNQCKIGNENWWKQNRNKLGLGSLLCVLSRKDIQLKESHSEQKVCDFYKLWGISKSLGVNKLQDGLNLDYLSHDLNPFLWKWPVQKVQKLIGPIKLMVKLNDNQMNKFQRMIRQFKSGQQWGDKDSILNVNMYKIIESKITIKDNNVVVNN